MTDATSRRKAEPAAAAAGDAAFVATYKSNSLRKFIVTTVPDANVSRARPPARRPSRRRQQQQRKRAPTPGTAYAHAMEGGGPWGEVIATRKRISCFGRSNGGATPKVVNRNTPVSTGGRRQKVLWDCWQGEGCLLRYKLHSPHIKILAFEVVPAPSSRGDFRRVHLGCVPTYSDVSVDARHKPSFVLARPLSQSQLASAFVR